MKKIITILFLLPYSLSFAQYIAYWTVVSNDNINYFTIQSSKNQSKWYDITTVPVKDSTSYNAAFNTNDNFVRIVANRATTSFYSPIVQIVTTLPVGLSKVKIQKKTYQLKSFSISRDTVKVDTKQHLKVKGHTENGTLFCEVQSPRNENLSIAISDIVGRWVTSSKYDVIKGLNKITIPFEYPSGIYLLDAYDFLDNVIEKFFNLR